MKSFTAKEFSRCPAKVYEAAREDGSAEITHDRFNGAFVITYKSDSKVSIDHYKFFGIRPNLGAHKKAPD